MVENNQTVNIQILGRIITLETRLANTIEKIDKLVDTVERRHTMLAGDENTPSLISRVINLEQSKKTAAWFFASIYTALLGLVISFIKDRL